MALGDGLFPERHVEEDPVVLVMDDRHDELSLQLRLVEAREGSPRVRGLEVRRGKPPAKMRTLSFLSPLDDT